MKTTKTQKAKRVIRKKHWTDHLWIVAIIYFSLGFFNIIFAWLGLVFFITPLLIALIKGNKAYCNTYCDRSRLFNLLGGKLGFTLNRPLPKFFRSNWFRYGFLTFFMANFFLMLYSTYLVFAGAELRELVRLFWTFDVPWRWTNTSFVAPGVAQFAFGFYGMMLTAMLIGLIMMMIFKPNSWCVICPMGTMTQGICKIKHRNDENLQKNK